MNKTTKLICTAFAVSLLAACQTTRDGAYTGPAVADAGQHISGEWKGSFINSRGRSYPVTFTFSGQSGTITGNASIPSSSVDTSPTVTGSYSGSKVSFMTSSRFKYETTMTTDGAGRYALSGSVTGPNDGSVELIKAL